MHQTISEDDDLLHSQARSGLSPDQIRSLENEREKFFKARYSTREGLQLNRRCHPDVDMMTLGSLSIIQDLSKMMNTETIPKTTAAATAISDISHAAQRAASSEFHRARTAPFRLARSAHAFMDRKWRIRQTANKVEFLERITNIWGKAGNLLSLTASAVVAVGAMADLPDSSLLAIAGTLIATRIAITAICWAVDAYPGDDSPDTPVLDSDPRACVLGHASDQTLMTAFSIYLMAHDHWVAGTTVSIAAMFMILGTVFRIVARAPRLHVERMMRGGSICISLFLYSWSWEAAVVVIMAGPVGFALIETCEAWKCLGDRTPRAIQVAQKIAASQSPHLSDSTSSHSQTIC